MTFYPNEVIKITRRYIEADLGDMESKLLDVNGKLDDDTFDAIAHELFTNVDEFIVSCYLKVECGIAQENQNGSTETINPTLF